MDLKSTRERWANAVFIPGRGKEQNISQMKLPYAVDADNTLFCAAGSGTRFFFDCTNSG